MFEVKVVEKDLADGGLIRHQMIGVGVVVGVVVVGVVGVVVFGGLMVALLVLAQVGFQINLGDVDMMPPQVLEGIAM